MNKTIFTTLSDLTENLKNPLLLFKQQTKEIILIYPTNLHPIWVKFIIYTREEWRAFSDGCIEFDKRFRDSNSKAKCFFETTPTEEQVESAEKLLIELNDLFFTRPMLRNDEFKFLHIAITKLDSFTLGSVILDIGNDTIMSLQVNDVVVEGL